MSFLPLTASFLPLGHDEGGKGEENFSPIKRERR